LHFSDCIRTLLKTVSIVEHGECSPRTFGRLTASHTYLRCTALPSPETQNMILRKTKNLTTTAITLDVGGQLKWDIQSSINNIVSWLNGSDSSNTSMLSAPEFLTLVKSTLGDETGTNFQRLIYAQSLAQTQGSASEAPYLSEAELNYIGAMAGHHCLTFLDQRLSTQSLSSCSRDELQVLLFLLLNTISAVSSTSTVAPFCDFPLDEVSHGPPVR
jgi:hypothetical protein